MESAGRLTSHITFDITISNRAAMGAAGTHV